MTAASPAIEALFLDATRIMGEGDLAAAEKAFRRVLHSAPELSEAHANLGYLLDIQGHPDAAEASYRQALTLAPTQAQTHINLGALLDAQGRYDEAEASYHSALTIDPESLAAWSNLGVLHASRKQEAAAEHCFRVALEMAPDYRKAAFNLALLLLRQGRYAEGWQQLETRDWYEPIQKFLKLPRWQGESLAGKAILIGLEAGHGDMIQFCRYGRTLRALGASRISILCHPPLKTLFQQLAGIDEILAVGDPLPDSTWDYWTPPLSLPHYLNTRLDTIPAELPYLQATPEKIAHWQKIIGNPGPGKRVGLIWKGNPRFENDAHRSLRSLADLAPLGQVPGLRFFSLQKGAGEDETEAPPFPITALGKAISDFSDTAAIMMHLDLIISVDTAAAHLAGALGRPCWVMLPDHKTDWRWLDQRKDSPWYPEVMRLFRQNCDQRWEPVLTELSDALADWVRSPD